MNEFDTIKFPIIRRIEARTIGMDLVTVQPLPAPLNTFEYADFVYKKPLTELEKMFEDFYYE